MTEGKMRDYRFDAIRGFCMWLIVFQHFIESANRHRNIHDPDGLIYFVIDLFVMQCFFFLSGYFSKKPERGSEIAIPALLWPLLVTWPFFFLVRAIGDFDYILPLKSPPFAMWFLLCLFYFRMFQKHYVKIPHIFGVTFVLSLFAPIVPYVGCDFALARAFSWAPYFLLGYYCRPENMQKICSVKWYIWAPLGVALILGSKLFLDYVNPLPYAGFVQMYDNIRVMGISWWGNILMRLILLPVSAGFMLILFNVFRNKKGIWAYLGMHTMPIYIFHIALFFVIQKHGAGLGLFTAPELNTPLYFAYFIVFSFLVSVVLASPPFDYLYTLLFSKSFNLFLWCFRHIGVPIGGAAEKVLLAINPFKAESPSRQNKEK